MTVSFFPGLPVTDPPRIRLHVAVESHWSVSVARVPSMDGTLTGPAATLNRPAALIMNELDVASLTPAPLALNVYVPPRLNCRSVDVATPLTAVTEVVPEREPGPLTFKNATELP